LTQCTSPCALDPCLSCSTGDAIRFDPALVTKGERLWIHTYLPQKHKRTEKPKPVEACISDRLKHAVDACEWRSPKLPFFYGSSKNPAYLADKVAEAYYAKWAGSRKLGLERLVAESLVNT
jgi:hypothetical protein